MASIIDFCGSKFEGDKTKELNEKKDHSSKR